ncbi:hypothetical protein BWR17_03450 [Phaeobacter inhibens]|nr:hypothetical protein BWR17_03450 [Phaeobacter inhibens]
MNSEAANTFAETIKNAGFSPWQLIVLVFGVIFLWNLPRILRIRAQKYETKRKYDHLDKMADDKIKLADEKRSRRFSSSPRADSKR